MHERIAHWRLADAELRRESVLYERRARPVFAREDLVANPRGGRLLHRMPQQYGSAGSSSSVLSPVT